MKSKINLIFILIIVPLLVYMGPVPATGNFIELKLPKAISIEMPKNWVILSNNQRITLDSTIESGLDLSGIQQESSTLPFAANYYDDSGHTAGIVNIRYYSNLDLSQEDAKKASVSEVNDLDSSLRENLTQEAQIFGMKIKSWQGTKKIELNGTVVFQTEYRRKSTVSNAIFRVRLVRVLANQRSFTLTVSYRESDEIFLKHITDRIISSLIME